MTDARVVIAEETGDTFWPEADALCREHFAEVEGSLAEVRPYEPDVPMLRMLNGQGIFKIVTARIDGRLVGYYTWTVMRDVESASLLVATQGAWYCSPDPECRGVAFMLHDHSIKILREMGCGGVFMHHRLLGRGRKLGAFFRRKGAVEIKHEYYLPLKGA